MTRPEPILFASPPCVSWSRPTPPGQPPLSMPSERRIRRAFVRLTLAKLHHRSATMADNTEDKGSITAQELRLFIERVERLEEEKKGIGDDIKDVMSEMKGRGYDTKIVRKLISIRKKKKGEHEEEAMILETYMAALGMI